MFDKRQYIINTATNYVVYFSNILVALVLSPFVVSNLGDVYYGVWSIIVAFTGYYGFLDIGLRQGTAQYVSRYLSSKEYDKLNVTVNSSLVMLSFIGMIVLVVSVVVSLFFCGSLIKQSSDIHAMKIAFLVLGAGIGLKFPFLLFQAVVNAKHRYDISGAIAFTTKMLYGMSVYLVLLNGHGIMGLALVTAGSQVLEGVLMMCAAKKLVPQICLRPSLPNRGAIKEVMGYGIYNFISGIANQTILYIGPMVIGKMIGPETVTYYVIGANLIPYYGSLIGILSIPLLQVIIAKDVSQEKEDLKLLYLNGTRYVNLLVTYIAFVLIILGKPFLGKWMGYKYVDSAICSSSVIMSILAFSQMVDLSQTIGRQVLFGVRKHKFLAIVNASSAVVTIGITLFMVYLFSATGAAIALLMQSMIINGIMMPIFICRMLDIRFFDYLKRCVFTNVLLFVVLTGAMHSLYVEAVIENWLSICFNLVFISCIYLTIGGYFVFGKDTIMRLMERFKVKTAVN